MLCLFSVVERVSEKPETNSGFFVVLRGPPLVSSPQHQPFTMHPLTLTSWVQYADWSGILPRSTDTNRSRSDIRR